MTWKTFGFLSGNIVIIKETKVMSTLTPRQKQVHDFVKTYRKSHDYSPSLEEIADRLGVSSVGTVHEHLKNLQGKGVLNWKENQQRSIEINTNEIIVQIPVIGIIAAGKPIEAIEDTKDYISISNNLIKNKEKCYALRVTGDSMTDEGIFDGDIVVIKKQSVADNGQTVVAIIDRNEATLKKIYREDGKFRLQPANRNMLPIYRKEVEVRGVVIQVIRNISNQPISELSLKNKLRTIDLFAGVGGIRLGFENAGFKTVFASDVEPQCKDTYDLNFKSSKLIVEDIKKIGIDDLPEFDFLLGGFPCQAFSIAGYRQGFKDKKGRGDLFFDIARILKSRKPTGLFLENVKNLKGHDKGRTFKIIEKTLSDLGYYTHVRILNTMKYGNIPQNRERLYIVGFKNKKDYGKFEFPKPVKLKSRVDDFLEDNVPKKYYYNGKPLYKKIKGSVTKKDRVYQWRRRYVRENKSGVCPTLTANMGTGGHNVPIVKDKKGIRKLTPLECARLQGFPKDYKLPSHLADSALYKQFGNSVSVPVIEAVARQILRAIG